MKLALPHEENCVISLLELFFSCTRYFEIRHIIYVHTISYHSFFVGWHRHVLPDNVRYTHSWTYHIIGSGQLKGMLMISSHGKVFFSVFWDGWHKPPAQNRQHGTHNLIQFASNYHFEKEPDLPTSSRPILVAFPCAFVWKRWVSLKISPFFHMFGACMLLEIFFDFQIHP